MTAVSKKGKKSNRDKWQAYFSSDEKEWSFKFYAGVLVPSFMDIAFNRRLRQRTATGPLLAPIYCLASQRLKFCLIQQDLLRRH
jgi:hypothetical protein